ncbi:putative transcriptional regulator for transition state genes (AbrB-SurF) [Ruminococcaceae bacterium BL-4]|jgi:AbrB family looped-hinge helix DNA binding protein|nr:putative transcriptional regulator for transition state genes (AbrB-SurF) [Ruminococcaceae bacterium BL-4]
MKATGVVRHIDNLGRIVIPKELRNTRGIKDGAPIEIFVDGDCIVLRKYEPETWTSTELKEALIRACQASGADPDDILDVIRRKSNESSRNY